MIRTLFIGDLHAKPDLLPLIEHAAKREQADRIILLGDLMDDWTVSNNKLIAWSRTFHYWLDRMSLDYEIIPLIGNHDVPYLINRGPSWQNIRRQAAGFKSGAYRQAHEQLRSLIEPMRIAWSDGVILATHAGVTQGWRETHGLGHTGVTGIEAWLNARRDTFGLAGLWNAIGFARGGTAIDPSPLWADASELADDMPDGFDQIVGHTPVSSVTRIGHEVNGDDRFVWLCDTMSTDMYGCPLGDRSLLVMEAEDRNRNFFTAPLLG